MVDNVAYVYVTIFTQNDSYTNILKFGTQHAEHHAQHLYHLVRSHLQ